MSWVNQRNPLLPLEHHVPDGEAHVMPDGRLYVYGSYDKHPDFYCGEEYHVVSTPDMKHWTVHGVSFEGKNVPWFGDPDAPKFPGGIDWYHPTPFLMKLIEGMTEEQMAVSQESRGPESPLLFAPDCICKDGKYYLYFCMSDDSEGVAVSDSPAGPFQDPVQLPCGGIDPAVFIDDDDGKAYFYWGQIYGHGVQLNPDMVSFDPDKAVRNLVTEEEHHFHEGSSMRKIGDTYYYVFADVSRGKPTCLGYATGRSPLGPFTYRGVVIDNDGCDPQSWNNHGSIECVNGQWYVFYHRCSRNTRQYRRLSVEKLHINEDGSIPEVKMTSQGVGEPFGQGETIMGYQACGLTGGAYIDVDGEYGEKLTNIHAGDTAVFRYVKSDKPWTGIRLTARGVGTIEVLLNGELAGTVRVTEGKTEAELSAPAGEYELTLRFVESTGLELLDITLF